MVEDDRLSTLGTAVLVINFRAVFVVMVVLIVFLLCLGERRACRRAPLLQRLLLATAVPV